MEDMEDFELPDEAVKKVMDGYSKFEGLSKEKLEVIVDELLGHLKAIGPELTSSLGSTLASIEVDPEGALEILETSLTNKIAELITFFTILSKSTESIPSLKLYLRIVTNLVPFFMQKLGIIEEKDTALMPLLFTLSDAKFLQKGDGADETAEGASVDAEMPKMDMEALSKILKGGLG